MCRPVHRVDTSLFSRKRKMFSQMFVVLNPFNNHIQSIRPDTEICFCQCDKVFAIMWIHPHTILKPYESVFFHKPPQSYSHASAPFGNNKDDPAPPTVPFPLFCMSDFLYL